ncbi:unnamed protein product [Linum tenue]|uniref:Protein kinase domain-containing protein n=1 Tax=Linum tenue TaxID=586396 RepID=A0AAV0S6T8_9ROSI|nr:unnamed protein product [Linum tenue]
MEHWNEDNNRSSQRVGVSPRQAAPPVNYRDFKSSNILLHEGFHPKLSDFGVAKLGPIGDKSHVSTRVMGTYGYCAPEYAMTGQLTIKSDVYSFEVVFLELITKFSKLVDPRLQGRYPVRGLYQALAVALMCIQEQAATRPLIGDVVTILSYLANSTYEPNANGSGVSQKGSRDERGGFLSRVEDGGGGSGSRWDLDGFDKDDSPRDPTIEVAKTRDLERERSVAEAKM